MTEWLHFHFSVSCIGEGNGNPLQCSCLENPRDGGAWWAAICGVSQSQTRLKWLSSSSSIPIHFSLLIPKMLMFNLAIYCLTTSNLLWFLDLITFQGPMQYCSSQHQNLLSAADTDMTEHHFCFGPATSFFLEVLAIVLWSTPVVYWTHADLGGSSSGVILFAFSYCSWGSIGKNAAVVCHFLLQWTTFFQNSSL